MKVRMFHGMNKQIPQGPIPEDFVPQQRVKPKKATWEEVLSQFEKAPPPPPAVSNEAGLDPNGTANSSTPR